MRDMRRHGLQQSEGWKEEGSPLKDSKHLYDYRQSGAKHIRA